MNTFYDRKYFFMSSLLKRSDYSLKEINERIKALQIDNFKSDFLVGCFDISYNALNFENKDEMIEKCYECIKKHLSYYCYLLIDENGFIWALLYNLHPDVSIDDLFSRVRCRLMEIIDGDVYVGVGSVVKNANEIYLSSADAKDMLAYKYQYSQNGIIDASNIVQFKNRSASSFNISYNKVINAFLSGNLSELSNQLVLLVEGIRNTPNVSKTSIRRAMIELTVQVLNIASNSSVDVDEVLEGKDPYTWIMSQGHTEVIEEWFLKICTKLLEKMNQEKDKKENQTIVKVKDYIIDNINDSNLSLSNISQAVGLTGPYLSVLFKQETSVGINNYITDCRIERAKTLLKQTDIKVEDIAVQVGFNSVAYFSTVFKNHEGITPNEYRKS